MASTPQTNNPKSSDPNEPPQRQSQSFPLGATLSNGGVNFSIYSKFASSVELLLFDRPDDAEPIWTHRLSPAWNRTYHYWHLFVPGIEAGQIYGFRVHGPNDPEHGLRFDAEKVLLDPYGRAIAVPDSYDRGRASSPGPNTGTSMKSVVADVEGYDWRGDRHLRRSFERTVIYEMHLAGFTRHPSSGLPAQKRGTYAGLIEKIPYLVDLGVTAVELLPVFQFDAQDAPLGRTNYWGYSPVSFFAPHLAYAACRDPLGALDEFRDMVKALHHAGIEVILDVVYNHTAEGDANGPTLCYRGLASEAYYILEKDGSYANYSGTGNALNANHTVTRRLILDSLRYWVDVMHVDGFRFDLASILSRDDEGLPMRNPPLLWDIDSDPVLCNAKMIAEAWDAAGLYQVGHFSGDSWREWNGVFRDDVRRFVKSDPDTVQRVAARLLGSPDIYGHTGGEPEQSINFVTCHDGFTLNDLVSYNEKHNEANGENNRDGMNENYSWNCGAEGPTDDPGIENLRIRQIKNMLAINLLSLGTPMLLMGDEVRRTQHGNNNAYSLDNELSWFDWRQVEQNQELIRFVRILIGYRTGRSRSPDRPLMLQEMLRHMNVTWHGVRFGKPDWSEHSHALALSAYGHLLKVRLHVILNAYWEPLKFKLPKAKGLWRCSLDTALPSPDDIAEWGSGSLVTGTSYRAESRSVVLMVDSPEN